MDCFSLSPTPVPFLPLDPLFPLCTLAAMFSESMTEAEVNRGGASSDLRYFHTSYGATFGYNERARKSGNTQVQRRVSEASLHRSPRALSLTLAVSLMLYACRYHRSYGLVTPPNNPAFSDYQLGDLATAPLFRRDHLGFRADYPEDAPYSWAQGANKLSKNAKDAKAEPLR